MTDFLLELASEEIPARMQAGARADLEKLFTAQLAAAGLAAARLTVWSGPRRLSLIAHDLPDSTEAVREERKGPRADAPEQAVAGFLRGAGIARDDCTVRDVKGVPTLFAVIEKPGRATRDVLAEAIAAIVRAFPWPKSMRWGPRSGVTTSLRWVRPLTGIVALFGEELVECAVDGIVSGYESRGHRFHHGGVVTIGSAADYAEKLRAVHVVADHVERQALIREGAKRAAAQAGLELVEDEGLVIENAGLTEWPVPLVGRFDAAFLEVPPEVIQLTARVNQKYFICRSPDGALANAFVCTANIAASDGGTAIVAGNRKVLAARLSDARFFWEQDRKKTLDQHAERLEDIVFHEKLGSVADKVERVAKLARWLVEEGIIKSSPSLAGEGDHAQHGGGAAAPAAGEPAVPSTPSQTAGGAPPHQDGEETSKARLADMAEQAARLCKADLVTEMVGEFPELQGMMGGYYARAEGLPDAVADAIRDHYKPVGQGDAVPTAPVTVAVALADKLDTLASFFEIEEFPTGSKDPFALRRAAIAAIRLIRDNDLKLHLGSVLGIGWLGHGSQTPLAPSDVERRKIIITVPAFIFDRLEVMMRDDDLHPQFIAASRQVNSEPDGRIDLALLRARALQSFMGSEDGANLHAGYKRAANILRKERFDDAAPDQVQDDQGIAQTGEEDPLVLVDDPILGDAVAEWAQPAGGALEPAEAALTAAVDAAGHRGYAAVAAEDFAGAMAALASLRAPIDRFFDEVTVNADDPDVRARRLGLLARFRDAVHRVADFSKIEG